VIESYEAHEDRICLDGSRTPMARQRVSLVGLRGAIVENAASSGSQRKHGFTERKTD
jgi:hypothetical protein